MMASLMGSDGKPWKIGIIFSDRAMYTHICYISLYIRHFMESIIVRVVITKKYNWDIGISFLMGLIGISLWD